MVQIRENRQKQLTDRYADTGSASVPCLVSRGFIDGRFVLHGSALRNL